MTRATATLMTLDSVEDLVPGDWFVPWLTKEEARVMTGEISLHDAGWTQEVCELFFWLSLQRRGLFLSSRDTRDVAGHRKLVVTTLNTRNGGNCFVDVELYDLPQTNYLHGEGAWMVVWGAER